MFYRDKKITKLKYIDTKVTYQKCHLARQFPIFQNGDERLLWVSMGVRYVQHPEEGMRDMEMRGRVESALP